MKILVLQLARLGDIYQCWPTLKGLKRLHPNGEVHVLTRVSFSAAVPAFVDRHWSLDTKEILAPVIDERPNLDEGCARLEALTTQLVAESYDKIINLSYSPFSASLVAEIASQTAVLANKNCEIAGYTRFADRTLSIPDDASAYFYAQVGIGKGNRLHVCDLFAHTAGVELTNEDWNFSTDKPERDAIVIHLGASQLAKTLSWSKWLQIVKGLLSATDAPVVLIGSRDEAEIASKVAAVSGPRQPVNLVGRTNLEQLFDIIRHAKLVIGGDSAPVQIASLTDTPVFNFSFPIVSLWETGPRSVTSRILPLESEDSFTADEIIKEILSQIDDEAPTLPIVRVTERSKPYKETAPQPRAFEWELLKALYMGESFPVAPTSTFALGIERLQEVNQLAIEQIDAIEKDPKNQTASMILDRADDVMEQVLKFVPEAGPIVRWFRVERLRIGPMTVTEMIHATRSIHKRLGDVLNLYVPREESHENVGLDWK